MLGVVVVEVVLDVVDVVDDVDVVEDVVLEVVVDVVLEGVEVALDVVDDVVLGVVGVGALAAVTVFVEVAPIAKCPMRMPTPTARTRPVPTAPAASSQKNAAHPRFSSSLFAIPARLPSE